MRDAVAYLLSTLALLALMLRGTFTAWEAALLLLGYVAYLVTVTCWITSSGSGAGAGAHRHTYCAVSPSQGQLQAHGQHAAEQQQQQQQLNGVVVAAGGLGVQEALPLPTPRAQVELVSRVGGPQPQRKASRAIAPDLGGAPGSRPTSPARGKFFEAAAVAQQQQQQDAGVQENELVALVAGTAPSDAPLGGASAAAGGGLPAASPRAPPWRGGSKLRRTASGGIGGKLAGVLQSASLGLEELLHTKGKSGPRLWLSMLMAPFMLLLHATMPALHTGE